MSEEAKANQVESGLAGIGGWLILPAIGMVLSPILGVAGAFLGLDSLNDLVRHGYGVYAIPRYIAMIGLLIYTIMAAIRFFKKRSNAPATVIKLLIARVAMTLVFFIIGIIVFGSNNEELLLSVLTTNNFIVHGIAAAIWITYFKISKRVRATFVN